MNATTDGRTQTREQRRQAQDRATARALEMAEAGCQPTLHTSQTNRDGLSTLQRWTVPSRTAAATFYSVTLLADGDGLHTECSCRAGEDGKPCWHRALARMASLHEAPSTDARWPVISKSELFGRPDPWPAVDAVAAYAAVS